MLDKFTFGNSPAAINLVTILLELEDPNVTSKVERYLCNHNQSINAICDIEDHRQRKKLLQIYRRHATTTPTYGAELEVPPKVRTHMYNVLVGKIKKEIEDLNIVP